MYVLCDVRFAPIPINDYSNGCLMGLVVYIMCMWCWVIKSR